MAVDPILEPNPTHGHFEDALPMQPQSLDGEGRPPTGICLNLRRQTRFAANSVASWRRRRPINILRGNDNGQPNNSNHIGSLSSRPVNIAVGGPVAMANGRFGLVQRRLLTGDRRPASRDALTQSKHQKSTIKLLCLGFGFCPPLSAFT